jgi:hypothetical protein
LGIGKRIRNGSEFEQKKGLLRKEVQENLPCKKIIFAGYVPENLLGKKLSRGWLGVHCFWLCFTWHVTEFLAFKRTLIITSPKDKEETGLILELQMKQNTGGRPSD